MTATRLPLREWSEADYYADLGVGPQATPDEIDAAFRALAKDLHPDRKPGDRDAEARFKRVAAAYVVLRDPVTKQAYDDYRRGLVRRTSGAGTGRPPAAPAEPFRGHLAPARRPKARKPMSRRTRLLIGWALIGLALVISAWAAVGHVDDARVRAGSVPTEGIVARDAAGRRVLRYATAEGKVVDTRLPADRDQAGLGQRIGVRYDPATPASYVLDQSRLLVDITLAIAALKLAVGGAIVLAYPRLQARFHRTPTTVIAPAGA